MWFSWSSKESLICCHAIASEVNDSEKINDHYQELRGQNRGFYVSKAIRESVVETSVMADEASVKKRILKSKNTEIYHDEDCEKSI